MRMTLRLLSGIEDIVQRPLRRAKEAAPTGGEAAPAGEEAAPATDVSAPALEEPAPAREEAAQVVTFGLVGIHTAGSRKMTLRLLSGIESNVRMASSPCLPSGSFVQHAIGIFTKIV